MRIIYLSFTFMLLFLATGLSAENIKGPTATNEENELTYTVTLESEQDVTLTGAGEYEQGQVVQINTENLVGFSFTGWTGLVDDVNLLADAQSMETSFTMPDRNVTFTAVYEPLPEYTVTLNAEQDVVLSGAGDYAIGVQVQISTQNVDGFGFTGWSGADEDVALLDDPLSLETTFAMPDHNVTFTATYLADDQLPMYTVTLTADFDVELTGAGDHKFSKNVEITAGVLQGYNFTGWSGNTEDVDLLENKQNATTTFTMPNRNVTFKATYALIPPPTFTLSLNSDQDASLTGAGDYQEGEMVEISAENLNGFNFTGWSGTAEDVALLDNAQDLTTSLVMPGRHVTFTANYEENQPAPTFSLSLTSEQDVTLTGTGDYEEGVNVQISASELSGYDFVGWSGSEEDLALLQDRSTLSTSLSMPDRNVSLEAVYSFIDVVKPTFELTLTSAHEAALTGAGAYEEGVEVQISAREVSGYEFVNWFGNEQDLALLNEENSMEATLTMPARDVSLEAVYVAVVTSVEELKNSHVLLTPNPCTRGFQISNAHQASVSIFSLHGELLITIEHTNPVEVIDMSHFPAGTYIVQLNFGTEILNQRLIKQ